MGERRQEEERQQFATEGARVGEMSGREQEKTLWRGATVRTSVVTQTEIKACGRSFDSFAKEAKELSVLCLFAKEHVGDTEMSWAYRQL